MAVVAAGPGRRRRTFESARGGAGAVAILRTIVTRGIARRACPYPSGAMRVDWAIPCRYAEVNGGLATLVGAPVEAAAVGEIPARVGSWLALRLLVGRADAASAHDLIVQ